MSHVTLHRLLGPRGRLASAVRPLLDQLGPDIGIRDAGGTWLAGTAPGPPGAHAGRASAGAEFPVLLDGAPIGWVCGTAPPGRLAAVAGLLSFAAAGEAEKRALATELLDRYRELNLLYTLAEKVAANPQPTAMAATALDEAIRLIPAQAGAVLMLCGDTPCPELMAASGAAARLRAVEASAGLVDRVLRGGQPELENDVPVDATGGDGGSLSLLCAPLKTENHVLGALLLVRESPGHFSAGELKLLNSVALQAAPALEVARLHQVAVANARMERELQMARQVQASLIPARMPDLPGWQFAAEWHPAFEVAGDYYDLISTADGQWSLVIADVAGKGMPASLFMVFTRSVLRAVLDQAYPPASGLARANQLVTDEAREGMFVTLFYARLDPVTGELTYVNAGHNPPLLYRAASGEVVPLTRSGVALGLMYGADYEQVTLHLGPGDLILFYTDGVTEAFNDRGEQFGDRRLVDVLRAHQGGGVADLLGAVEAAVDHFAAGTPPSDDLTLLALKRV